MRKYIGVAVVVVVVAVAIVAWAKSNNATSNGNLAAGDSGLSPYDIMIKLKDIPVQTFEDLI